MSKRYSAFLLLPLIFTFSDSASAQSLSCAISANVASAEQGQTVSLKWRNTGAPAARAEIRYNTEHSSVVSGAGFRSSLPICNSSSACDIGSYRINVPGRKVTYRVRLWQGTKSVICTTMVSVAPAAPAAIATDTCIKSASTGSFVFSNSDIHLDNHIGRQAPNALGRIVGGPIRIAVPGVVTRERATFIAVAAYDYYYNVDFLDNTMGRPDGWVKGERQNLTGRIIARDLTPSSSCASASIPDPARVPQVGDCLKTTVNGYLYSDRGTRIAPRAANSRGTVVEGPRELTYVAPGHPPIRIKFDAWKLDFGGGAIGWVPEEKLTFCQ